VAGGEWFYGEQGRKKIIVSAAVDGITAFAWGELAMSIPLLSLLQLSDPALPIGAYVHSGGLETYVQEGIVFDRESADRWVRDVVSTSVAYTDAALVALAYKGAGDVARIAELDRLCEAVKAPREIREASRMLGKRLWKIFEGMVGDEVGARAVHYPVVFGCCAVSMGIGLTEALTGYFYTTAAGMVTNCVKLVPLGQQDGQELLMALQPLIARLVERGMEPDEGMVGLCCTALDIRCMRHERLYSRLYMS
jgi:urease accessory protein